MSGPEVSSQSKNDPEQVGESSEDVGRQSDSEDGGWTEDTLTLVVAVRALTDLTEDARICSNRTDDTSDPVELVIVAFVATGLATGHARVRVESQTWPVMEAGVSDASPTWGELHRVGEKVRDRVREEAADLLTSSWWDQATACWKTQDYGDFALAADELAEWDHALLQQFLDSAGLPDPVDAAIIFVVPLPGDKLMSEIASVVRVAGIAFAFASGHAVWACASLKSLMHEKLVDTVASVIRKEIASALSQVTVGDRTQAAADARKLAKLRALGYVGIEDSALSEKPHEPVTAEGAAASRNAKSALDWLHDTATEDHDASPEAASGHGDAASPL